jgi:hypothetical protein
MTDAQFQQQYGAANLAQDNAQDAPQPSNDTAPAQTDGAPQSEFPSGVAGGLQSDYFNNGTAASVPIPEGSIPLMQV